MTITLVQQHDKTITEMQASVIQLMLGIRCRFHAEFFICKYQKHSEKQSPSLCCVVYTRKLRHGVLLWSQLETRQKFPHTWLSWLMLKNAGNSSESSATRQNVTNN